LKNGELEKLNKINNEEGKRKTVKCCRCQESEKKRILSDKKVKVPPFLFLLRKYLFFYKKNQRKMISLIPTFNCTGSTITIYSTRKYKNKTF
jgi:hypothetical protein